MTEAVAVVLSKPSLAAQLLHENASLLRLGIVNNESVDAPAFLLEVHVLMISENIPIFELIDVSLTGEQGTAGRLHGRRLH
jgi:hypothetical protein